jgi:TrmH family RNA methyltransferase
MSFCIVEISSPRNPSLQDIRQAAAKGRPTADGLFVAEGPHLVEELLHSKWALAKLIFTPETLPIWERHARLAAVETIVVPQRTFQSIAETGTSQGVMALARPRQWKWEDLQRPPSLIVVLDGIQDPGNAGTIIRSAEAFGATGAVMLKNSVRTSNGKFMRASAGSVFHLPICEGFDCSEFLQRAKETRLRLFSLDAGGRNMISGASFDGPCALITGSEANGVSQNLLEASEKITVKTQRVESLNAAVACSVALYDISRQRQLHESVRR